ncbi:hypothetical protein PoB_001999400 [Plakobranchus ocellatus]|uniref:Uncharacterized protein n=1 Tax=Plakobranchus ocellatus TaxID=259542 RepID=A0AAV3ZHY5_9GAST|nr:hypothetical protein PoB_001999400 [Plakobranchus ocellatus]
MIGNCNFLFDTCQSVEFCRYTVYKVSASVVNLNIETSTATNAIIVQKVCNFCRSFSAHCFCLGPLTEIINRDHHAWMLVWREYRLQLRTMDMVVFRQDEAVLILFEDGALWIGNDQML